MEAGETNAIEIKRGGVPLAVAAWAVLAVAILVGVYGAVSSGVLTWSMAVDAREAASAFMARYAPLAYAGYVALFVVLALALFPAQLWIILFGAILFGFWPALLVSWASAVVSSLVVFLLARGALSGVYRKRAGRYLSRIETAFLRDQFSWMLAMRFFPAMPYCITNVVPAVLGARLPLFLIATMIGISPYIAIYTFAGARAAAVLDRDAPPDVASLASDLAPVMLAFAVLPLVALGARRLFATRLKRP